MSQLRTDWTLLAPSSKRSRWSGCPKYDRRVKSEYVSKADGFCRW